MTCIKHIITILVVAIATATALASEPLEKPRNPGVHGAYIYKSTDTINGILHEEAEVIRRENIKPVETTDTLILNVLRDDIRPSLDLLRVGQWLEDKALTFYMYHLGDDHTHLVVCEAAYLDKSANQIVFDGSITFGQYKFVIEDSLCRDFGAKPLPGAKAERTRIIYGWGAQDARSLMYQPIVWHLTRDLDGWGIYGFRAAANQRRWHSARGVLTLSQCQPDPSRQWV